MEQRLEEERARTQAARSHASEAYRLENGSYINTIEEESAPPSQRKAGTDSALASARAVELASERSEEFRRRVEALEEEKRGFEELLSQREQEKSFLEVKNREVEERNAQLTSLVNEYKMLAEIMTKQAELDAQQQLNATNKVDESRKESTLNAYLS